MFRTRDMPRQRVLLHSPMGWRRLAVGTYTLGRGKDCDIVVASNRASRKHAQLSVTDSGATLEDLSSANGTHVNGVAIRGPHTLANEDFIVIGESGIDVVIEPDVGASKAPVLDPRGEAGSVRKEAADATVGYEDEGADRWIETWSHGVLEQARAGQLLDEQTRRSAMRFGIELAVNRRTRHWVDFVLELAARGVPLSLERAQMLQAVIAEHGASSALLDGYLATLRALGASTERDALLSLATAWRANAR